MMPPGWCGCCCCCWRWHELVGLFGCEIRSLTVPRVRWVRPTEIKKEKALLLTLLEKVRASSQEREAPLLPVLELDSYHAQTQVSVGNQSSKLRKEEEKKGDSSDAKDIQQQITKKSRENEDVS